MALAPGTRLGRFEVIAPLGAGGMGFDVAKGSYEVLLSSPEASLCR